MTIKTIRRLEDIQRMRAGELAEVAKTINLYFKSVVTLPPAGIVYNIGIDRFSLIEPMMTFSRDIGRVNYDWSPSDNAWLCSIDENQPFEKNSAKYRKYESLLNKLSGELTQVA